MNVRVEYVGDGKLLAYNENNQAILMGWGDGQQLGIRPMEAVLAALGACSAVDIVEILKKMRKSVDGLYIELSGERVNDYPRVYSRVNIMYILYSRDASEDDVKRAVDLSMEKYCSVAAMLRRGGVNIEYNFKLKKTQ